MPDLPHHVSIDVGHLVRRNLASLYSSLVTRPTGQAVRLAIENVLADETGPLSLSVVDFSEVTVMDFSCADEVVAKLLLRYLQGDRPREALFILRGIRELHREPIEAVLERHALVAVAETEGGDYELLGSFSPEEASMWETLQERGGMAPEEAQKLWPGSHGPLLLARLVDRRVAFRDPRSGRIRALSALLAPDA